MSRPFEFTQSVKDRARLRQNGLCAKCGELMDDLEENAHHVIPNQSGDPKKSQHIWLKGEENCVVLCRTCHNAVHAHGRFRSGATAPPDYFENSHGGDRDAHVRWVNTLKARARTL